MAPFRPKSDQGDPRYTHSPFVRPETLNGVRCVMVDERLREIDPRALDFVLGFAKDLQKFANYLVLNLKSKLKKQKSAQWRISLQSISFISLSYL